MYLGDCVLVLLRGTVQVQDGEEDNNCRPRENARLGDTVRYRARPLNEKVAYGDVPPAALERYSQPMLDGVEEKHGRARGTSIQLGLSQNGSGGIVCRYIQAAMGNGR